MLTAEMYRVEKIDVNHCPYAENTYYTITFKCGGHNEEMRAFLSLEQMSELEQKVNAEIMDTGLRQEKLKIQNENI